MTSERSGNKTGSFPKGTVKKENLIRGESRSGPTNRVRRPEVISSGKVCRGAPGSEDGGSDRER